MLKLKIILFSILFISILFYPAFGQISDRTGLKQTFTIETDGYEFEFVTTSNFNVNDYEFSSNEKRLTLFIESSIENNLSEIIIPRNLINGNFTFMLNDEEIFPNVRMTEQISFITLEFQGVGNHTLDIIGTTYLPEFSDVVPLVLATSLIGIIFFKRLGNHSLIKD